MTRKSIFIFILLTALFGCWTYIRSASGRSADRQTSCAEAWQQGGSLTSAITCKSPDFIKFRSNATGLDFALLGSYYAFPGTDAVDSPDGSRVSRYDDLIRVFSDSINWDWRLLASLIWQESRFRPDVVSGRGAYGLMQIMPGTGRNFGIDIKSSPENNLRAGILYITWLYSIFDARIPNEAEKLSFVLAAYNAGPGHVLDAMRLAEKHGMDPQKWEGSVAVWLLKKSEPRYYRDSVVRSGYFRGRESVKFVSEVLGRYEHYKVTIPEEANFLF